MTQGTAQPPQAVQIVPSSPVGQSQAFNWQPVATFSGTIVAAVIVTMFGFRNNRKLEKAKAIRQAKEKHLENVTKLYSDLYGLMGTFLLDSIRLEQMLQMRSHFEDARDKIKTEGMKALTNQIPADELQKAISRVSEDAKTLGDEMAHGTIEPALKIKQIWFVDTDAHRLVALGKVGDLYELVRKSWGREQIDVSTIESSLNGAYHSIRVSIQSERAALDKAPFP